MLRRFFLRVLAWILPERCIFCGEVIPAFSLCCDACRETLFLIHPPLCPLCGMSKSDCTCRRHRHRYDTALSPFYCEGAAHSGVLRLKYYDDPRTIAFFADQMATVVRRECASQTIDAVTAVPVTYKKLEERGFNQSELLAREVATRLSVPYQGLLVKIYETAPQKKKHAWERAGNVLGVFDVPNNEILTGKTILLVDDVLTTGSTADECAKMLKIYGATRVICLTASIRRQQDDDAPDGN